MPAKPLPEAARAAAVLAIVGLLLAGGLWRRHAARAEVRHDLDLPPTMGTFAALTLWGDEAACRGAAAEVAATFAAINDRFSTYRPESEVSRLNATAHETPFVCSDELWLILEHARWAHRVTDGAFDITAGPLMKLWGFHHRRQTLPTAAEVAAAAELVGLDKVVFDDARHTVAFPRQGMALDFGGMVKGYAVDQAAAALIARGLTRGLVNLGGNIRVLPDPPPGRDHYTIGVRNPRNPRDDSDLLAVVQACDLAIATSGDYERFVTIDGKRYTHIMDPRTGRPVENIAGVSVTAPSALTADILSTGIFVNHGNGIPTLLAELPRLGVYVVTVDANNELREQEYGGQWAHLAAGKAAPQR